MPNLEYCISTMNKYGKERIPFLVLIDYDMACPQIWTLSDLPEDILFATQKLEKYPELHINKTDIQLKRNKIPFADYQKAFQIVQEHLHVGNTYLANLTFATEITTNLSLEEIFTVSKAPFRLKYKDEFVVFSPEGFVEIKNNQIATFPMKGTIDAEIPNAQDIILNDLKETAEHATIVDLLRNDLSKVATNVHVEKYRYIDKIFTNQKPILQVSSKITGALPSNWSEQIGSILFQLLPAGSVTGAPKKKTVEIINQAETHQRGYYTGIFGVFDGEEFSSAVNIRFIQKQNGKLFFKSGGGITAMSNLESEYNELNQKIYVPLSRID